MKNYKKSSIAIVAFVCIVCVYFFALNAFSNKNDCISKCQMERTSDLSACNAKQDSSDRESCISSAEMVFKMCLNQCEHYRE